MVKQLSRTESLAVRVCLGPHFQKVLPLIMVRIITLIALVLYVTFVIAAITSGDRYTLFYKIASYSNVYENQINLVHQDCHFCQGKEYKLYCYKVPDFKNRIACHQVCVGDLNDICPGSE